MPKGMLSMLKSQLLGGISSQDSAAAVDAAAGSAAAAVAAAESAMVDGLGLALAHRFLRFWRQPSNFGANERKFWRQAGSRPHNHISASIVQVDLPIQEEHSPVETKYIVVGMSMVLLLDDPRQPNQ
jgi:hypothetical protein